MSLTLEAPLAAENVTAARSERAATVTTAVLELTVRVSAAASAEAAAKALVDGLCHHAQADQVVLAVRRPNSPALRLVASSAVRQLSPSAPWVQDLTRVLNEPCGDDLCWLDDCPLFAEFGESPRIARLEFRTADGTSVGAAIVVWTNAARAGAAEPLLRLTSHALAPVMALHGRSLHHAWSTRIADCLPPWLTRRYRWALLGSVIVALAIPWPYTIKAQVTLEPVEHRFACAPFEGVFEQSLAQPGDQVEPGQVLGRMDGRELRTKLAALDAELARVTRSRDSNQATNKLAAAQIDRLEMERLTQERDLIERRMQQLEIRAPIGGVIVSGDLRRHAGATVNVGHTLYEVAPLERLITEVAIPEAEIEQTSVGAPLRIALSGIATQTLVGKLERIHPRAEVRDEQQVFIGEMTIENERGVFRPGMHGYARVEGPRTSGAWLLIRKPYLALRSLVGW